MPHDEDSIENSSGVLFGDVVDLTRLSVEALDRRVEELHEETLECLKEQMKSRDPEEAACARFQYEVYESMMELLDEVSDLIQAEDFEAAEKKCTDFLQSIKEKLEGMGVESDRMANALDEIGDFLRLCELLTRDLFKENRTKMSLFSVILDLMPFGGAKMIYEGSRGKTLMGEPLEGGARLVHMAEGTGWILVDTAAVLAGLATGGTAGAAIEGVAMAARAPKAAHLLEGASVFLRGKNAERFGGMAQKLTEVGTLMENNPILAEQADRLLRRGLDARNLAKKKAPEAVTDHRDRLRESAQVYELVHAERAELLGALASVFENSQEKAA